MLYSQVARGFGQTCLFAEQNNLDLREPSPGFDRVALNQRDVWIRKRLGGREKGYERHNFIVYELQRQRRVVREPLV